MGVAQSVTPWLHLGLTCAAILILASAAARNNDRESAYSLAVIGALILACVAAEHGALAYFRAR